MVTRRATVFASVVLGVVVAVTAGCTNNRSLAPVGREVKAPAREYVVQKGDTLYYIAWRFAKDYTALAAYNSLAPPYTIYAGQRIRLEAPQRVAAAPVVSRAATTSPAPVPLPAPSAAPAPTKPVKPGTPQAAAPTTARAASPPPVEKPARVDIDDNAPVARWTWPARGRVLGAFGSGGGNGIQIAGKRGQAVVAAAPGTVVYSGSGLIGYGKLIIVKHNKNFLSAYAHNDKILANEGDRVDLGQQIAQMGSSGTDRVKLHFEIRRDGKPVDPKRYLPD